jgi:hypothetical protein
MRRALEIFTCLAVYSTSMVSLRFFSSSRSLQLWLGNFGFYRI